MLKNYRYFWAVFFFFITAYVIGLGARPMVAPDEFRYAQIPLEMMSGGNFAAPRLLGMRYFEKPVLGYWLNAASFQLFGVNNFALRFPSALGAGLAALLIAIWVRQATRNEKLAAMASILYLSTSLIYAIGTFAVLDSQLTGFLTGTLGCIYLAIQEPAFNRRKIALLILCGIFAGLSFLTKGFLAFAVPGLSVIGYLLWKRKWKDFLVLPWIPLAVMLALVAPWVIAAHKADPDYWRYFIFVEHFQRFLEDVPGQHPESCFYYIPALLLGVLPAGFLFPTFFANGKGFYKKLFSKNLYQFCLCAVILPFLFFSVASGKLATYLAPCFPPLVILFAAGIEEYFQQGKEKHLAFQLPLDLFSIFLLLGGAGALIMGIFKSPEWLPSSLGIGGGILGMIYGLALGFTHWNSWKFRLCTFFSGLAVLAMIAEFLIPPDVAGAKTPEIGLRQLQQELQFDQREVVFITYPSFMHAAGYTFGRSDIKLLEAYGELEYGIKSAQKHGEPSIRISLNDFFKLLKEPHRPPIVLITRQGQLDLPAMYACIDYYKKRAAGLPAEFNKGNRTEADFVPTGTKRASGHELEMMLIPPPDAQMERKK